jgi:hypothetical protein
VNYSPISIALDGIGLNVTGFSYNGTMWVCAVSCREMMPDPAHFADCMRASFAELKEAAANYAASTDEPALGEDDLPPAAVRSKKRPAKPRARTGARKTARARRKPAVASADSAQG